MTDGTKRRGRSRSCSADKEPRKTRSSSRTKRRSRSRSSNADKERRKMRSSSPTKRNESRSWPIPKVEDNDLQKTIEKLENLNLESFSGSLPKRPPPLSTTDLLKKIQMEQREADDGTLMLVDLNTTNVKFDEDSLCLTLENKDRLCKPHEDTRIAYSQALRTVAKMIAEDSINTTRGLYYTCEEVFKTQKHSDTIIKHITSKLEVDRFQLNIIPGDVGSVIGDLCFTLYNELAVNCNLEASDRIRTKHGVRVPDEMRSISEMEGEVKFVLVVESLAVYYILTANNFHNRYKCLIMTGKGMPDVTVREFNRYVSEELGVAVFYLSDCDPNGIEIYTVYKYGSANMAFDSKFLANPNMIWLGIWPSDVTAYGLPSVEMTVAEVEKANQLLEKDFVKRDARLVKELQHMKDNKKKISICALNCDSPKAVPEFVKDKLKQVIEEILKEYESAAKLK